MRHILTITKRHHAGQCECGWTASDKSEDALIAHYNDHLRLKGLTPAEDVNEPPA